jgi:hypothetical protein
MASQRHCAAVVHSSLDCRDIVIGDARPNYDGLRHSSSGQAGRGREGRNQGFM